MGKFIEYRIIIFHKKKIYKGDLNIFVDNLKTTKTFFMYLFKNVYIILILSEICIQCKFWVNLNIYFSTTITWHRLYEISTTFFDHMTLDQMINFLLLGVTTIKWGLTHDCLKCCLFSKRVMLFVHAYATHCSSIWIVKFWDALWRFEIKICIQKQISTVFTSYLLTKFS